MKTIYEAEIVRDIDGNMWVNDKENSFNWMSDIDLAVYIGYVLKKTLELAREKNMAGSFFIDVEWREGGDK